MQLAFQSESTTGRVGGVSERVCTNVALFHPQTQMEIDEGLVLCVSCGDEGVPPEGVEPGLFYCEECL